MLSHPDSVIAFGLMRHQELQAETLQLRRAMAALPISPRTARAAVPVADLGGHTLDPHWHRPAGRTPGVQSTAPGAPRGQLLILRTVPDCVRNGHHRKREPLS